MQHLKPTPVLLYQNLYLRDPRSVCMTSEKHQRRGQDSILPQYSVNNVGTPQTLEDVGEFVLVNGWFLVLCLLSLPQRESKNHQWLGSLTIHPMGSPPSTYLGPPSIIFFSPKIDW